MGEDFLSLKWNNHKPAFFHLLKILREKGLYSDVTLACGSKFFAVHRLVLMACSDFFIEVFDHTHCQKPVIVLKDIKGQELEALLDYMYLGEVEVQQTDLPGLIKAAECLRIKGLAVPDEDPTQPPKADSSQKGIERPAKRRRQEREGRENDRGSAVTHTGERIELRGSPHVTQVTTVPQYVHQRSDIEIISGGEQDISPNTITVSHAGGDTPLITHDTTLVHRAEVLQVQQIQESPNRVPSPEAHLEQDSHLHHELTQTHQHTDNKELETFADSGGPEIKVEHIELEEEIESGTLKSEVTEIHSDQLNEAAAATAAAAAAAAAAAGGGGGGVGEFPHFMTVEENLAHHMFQHAQQAGPSGLHRPTGREGNAETGGEDISINRSSVGSAMYPTHLLGDTTSEGTPTTVSNQSGLVMTEGSVVRDEQGRLCYRCLYCPRVDSDKSKWRRHLRTHTGEKPYQCTKCPYRATTRHAVVRHDKFRHNLEGVSSGLSLNLGVKAEEKN